MWMRGENRYAPHSHKGPKNPERCVGPQAEPFIQRRPFAKPRRDDFLHAAEAQVAVIQSACVENKSFFVEDLDRAAVEGVIGRAESAGRAADDVLDGAAALHDRAALFLLR